MLMSLFLFACLTQSAFAAAARQTQPSFNGLQLPIDIEGSSLERRRLPSTPTAVDPTGLTGGAAATLRTAIDGCLAAGHAANNADATAKKAAYSTFKTVATTQNVIAAIDAAAGANRGEKALVWYAAILPYFMGDVSYTPCVSVFENDFSDLIGIIITNLPEQNGDVEEDEGCTDIGPVTISGTAYTCQSTYVPGKVWLLKADASATLVVLKAPGLSEIEAWQVINNNGVTNTHMCNMIADNDDITVMNVGNTAQITDKAFQVLNYIPGEEMMKAVSTGVSFSAESLLGCTQDIFDALDFFRAQTNGKVPDDMHWANIMLATTDEATAVGYQYADGQDRLRCFLIDTQPMNGDFTTPLTTFKGAVTGGFAYCGFLDRLTLSGGGATTTLKNKLKEWFCPPTALIQTKSADAYANKRYNTAFAAFVAAKNRNWADPPAPPLPRAQSAPAVMSNHRTIGVRVGAELDQPPRTAFVPGFAAGAVTAAVALTGLYACARGRRKVDDELYVELSNDV